MIEIQMNKNLRAVFRLEARAIALYVLGISEHA
jgi:hypothetical protein